MAELRGKYLIVCSKNNIMTFGARVQSFFKHFFSIIGKRHLGFGKRFRLLVTFFLVYIKRLMHKRVVNFDGTYVSVVGFRVYFDDFEDFFWSFKDIFLDESYYFKYENKQPIIIDAGANIGLSVLYFKWLYPEACITAFEPHPDTYTLLEKNVQVNSFSSIELHDIALSDRRGTITLFGKNRAATIVEGFFGLKGKWNKDLVENDLLVSTDKMSSFVDGHVDFLKLDIEGAESLVLSEMYNSGVLTQIDRIVMEYHHRTPEVNRLSGVLKTLEDARFVMSFSSNTKKVNAMTHWDFTHLMIVCIAHVK